MAGVRRGPSTSDLGRGFACSSPTTVLLLFTAAQSHSTWWPGELPSTFLIYVFPCCTSTPVLLTLGEPLPCDRARAHRLSASRHRDPHGAPGVYEALAGLRGLAMHRCSPRTLGCRPQRRPPTFRETAFSAVASTLSCPGRGALRGEWAFQTAGVLWMAHHTSVFPPPLTPSTHCDSAWSRHSCMAVGQAQRPRGCWSNT